MGCICGKTEQVNPLKVDLSHFELYRVVGRGAYGKVNAVKHRPTGKLMAMKRSYKDIVLKEQSDNVIWQERTLMAKFSSPFLVNLLYSFQNNVELFMVMPFLSGGDLHYHLSTRGAVPEEFCKFYIAEMILGLEEIHSLGYVYRDLKPANVLLDEEGHLRVSDFGLAKRLRSEKNYEHTGYAGTRGYTAPEMLLKQPYSFGADFWSLGVVAFELLHNRLPFETSEEITSKELTPADFLPTLSKECVSFIMGLLEKDRTKRLGYSKRPGGGWSSVKKHPWFQGTDWAMVAAKQYPVPFVPQAGVANCSAQFEAEDQLLSNSAQHKNAKFSAEEQDIFNGFSFNTGLFDENTAERSEVSTRNRHDSNMHDVRLSAIQLSIVSPTSADSKTELGEKRESPVTSSGPDASAGGNTDTVEKDTEAHANLTVTVAAPDKVSNPGTPTNNSPKRDPVRESAKENGATAAEVASENTSGTPRPNEDHTPKQLLALPQHQSSDLDSARRSAVDASASTPREQTEPLPLSRAGSNSELLNAGPDSEHVGAE